MASKARKRVNQAMRERNRRPQHDEGAAIDRMLDELDLRTSNDTRRPAKQLRPTDLAVVAALMGLR